MTAILSLVQWLSPAFPTGGFAYSHGLEQAATDGGVADAATLETWLAAILRHGTGRQDAILLAASLRPGADYDHLSDIARALAPSAERWGETLDQGTALARTVGALSGRDLPPRPLPVALGQAAADLGLLPAQVIAVYLHSFASNLVSGMVRFIPLGQTEGQAVLARLHPLIDSLAQGAAEASLDDIASAALGADLAALRHETLDVRIFKT